jgi:hypothetical protein
MSISQCNKCLFVLLAVLVTTRWVARAEAVESLTPILMTVQDAPVPFTGSDGRAHLVYELWVTNFSSGDVTIEKVDVLGDSAVLETLDAAAVARRLQPAGLRESVGTLQKSAQALLFLHVTLSEGARIPRSLSHRITAHVRAAPPGRETVTETGGSITIDRRSVVRVGPPIYGDHFISADSCCDASRHTRAALPVNGRVWVAQRFAVDWEQLDTQGRIYSGPREKLESYTIFGKDVIAVADAVVETVTDGYPEQTPGKYPTDIPVEAADGNSIILDLGQHCYALYAHLQPGSIKVKRGQKVSRGQVIALVGNSGNSVAPHLHFHIIDAPLSLAANGLPYEIENFRVTGKSPGTDAFDEAEAKGTPLAITPFSPPRLANGALPVDQLLISFSAR